MQFTVLDSDSRGVRHHDNRKTYYWYKAQKVIGTQGGSSGQLLHGLFESFYSNKQLCEKGSYLKGLKNGGWNYWRADGTLLKQEHWKKGRQKGTQLFYDTKGKLTKTTIIRGRRSTSHSGDSLVEICRNRQTVTTFDSLGHTLSVARYKKSLLHGKQETISGSEKTTEVYRNGELSVKKERTKKTKESAGSEDPKTDQAAGTEKEPFFKKLKKRFSRKNKTEGAATEDKNEKKTKKNTTEKTPKEPKPVSEKEQKKFRLFKRKSA